MGIDFTFGYFTAVEFLASEIRNLLADAEANRAYFLGECMGRSAGWLAYGVAIAGEASLVISVEDITGKYETSEEIGQSQDGPQGDPPRDGPQRGRQADRGHDAGPRRGRRQGVRRDRAGRGPGRAAAPRAHRGRAARRARPHRHCARSISASSSPSSWPKEYTKQTGKKRKVTGVPLGYESRCARPQAFDVMLGSQLGVGAYRALVEKRLDGVMVSIRGQLELNYVPLRPVGRSGHAGDRRALHRARQRLPPPGPVPGNVRERLIWPRRLPGPDSRHRALSSHSATGLIK